MRSTRRRLVGSAASFAAFGGSIVAPRAQSAWPSKPVRIIVPGGAGGVTDIRARWLAERLSPALGQSVVVENRAGAGGNLGTVAGVRSPPDGYTLLIVHIGTMTINPHIYPNPGYDPLTDIAPITRLGVGPQALAVHKDVPARSVEELLALARAKPGELTFVTPGVGTPGHLAASLLMHRTGIKVTHIPYKGGGQAVQDLIAGHVTFTIDGLTLLRPFVQDGRLRVLAVTTAQRARSMPDVPTMAEAGVPGYELTAWAGIAAPAGTPRPIIDRLYAEIARIAATAEAKAWFDSFGIDAGAEPPDAFAALVRTEYAQMGEVVRAMGIKAE
jgi:tripartite-type tricarboxylate transporter receptor subunit TctC